MKNEDLKQQADDALAKLTFALQALAASPDVPEEIKEELLGRNYMLRDQSSLPSSYRELYALNEAEHD